jgi:hypothetical protein
MNELLANDVHGGMDRWKAYKKGDATIMTGGGFFALKGMIQDPDPRRMSVWLHEERASFLPYGTRRRRTNLRRNDQRNCDQSRWFAPEKCNQPIVQCADKASQIAPASGVVPAAVGIGPDVNRRDQAPLPKSVEIGNLSLNKAVIRWMSVEVYEAMVIVRRAR